LDHARGIELAFTNGKAGETYNIGGRNERTNNQIVNVICATLDERNPRKNKTSYKNLITYVKDRAGHDKRYAIDATKIEKELGWKAQENFETGIRKTIDWYLKSILAKTLT
jgi:dTDP-glucose 4,6-dehydratase